MSSAVTGVTIPPKLQKTVQNIFNGVLLQLKLLKINLREKAKNIYIGYYYNYFQNYVKLEDISRILGQLSKQLDNCTAN